MPAVDEAVVVVPETWVERVRIEVSDAGISCLVLAGGATRQDSVRIAVNHFGDSISRILVHDAARPFVTADLVNRVVKGVEECGSCVPILPVGDTVKELREGKIIRTVPRDSLGLAQTPQGFLLQLLVNAYEQAEKD